MRYISHLLEWLSSRRQEITSIGDNAQQRETVTVLMGIQIALATMGNNMEVPEKI